MSARWDDDQPGYRREAWLLRAMDVLSLDVTRAIAGDLGLDEPTRMLAQQEVRRVLDPYFQKRLADPSERFPAQPMLAALDPAVQVLVHAFYDEVIRYSDGEPNALFCWGIVLITLNRGGSLWDALALPPTSSVELREAFRATHLAVDDIQDRLDAALAEPLSPWDQRVAVLRLFPPIDDDAAFGIEDTSLRAYAQVKRRQSFWRLAAAQLGEGGLRDLRARAQAFLATQKDLVQAFGQLYDPWLLAHPELTIPAGSEPQGA
jgi:hypothetical protein